MTQIAMSQMSRMETYFAEARTDLANGVCSPAKADYDLQLDAYDDHRVYIAANEPVISVLQLTEDVMSRHCYGWGDVCWIGTFDADGVARTLTVEEFCAEAAEIDANLEKLYSVALRPGIRIWWVRIYQRTRLPYRMRGMVIRFENSYLEAANHSGNLHDDLPTWELRSIPPAALSGPTQPFGQMRYEE